MNVEHVGWRVEGVVLGRCWDGTEGSMYMRAYAIDEPTRGAVLEGINDAGFGFESYISAECDVIEQFTFGAERYDHAEYFEADELVNAKRGI
ncbi:MAG: hypothetical protein KJ954_13740 [Alphaproteobacteria bacterium]|nr:hypothetical protein [Alphaproteobacteria bacterium]